MKSATSIESSRVLPAKTVVRPAVRRVIARRLERLGARRQLLAEARDHQQRVVDPQRQAHHRADGQREGVDREPVGEEVEDPARGDHGDRAEGERDRRRDRRAEDEQQDDQQERQGDQLAALGGGDRFVLDRPREASRSRSGSPAPAAWICSSRISFELRHGVVDRRLRCRRGSRRGSAPCAGSGRSAATDAAVPGRERRHLRVAGAGPRISAGPCRRAPPAGPAAGSRTAPSRRSVRAAARWRATDSVPGMFERGRVEPAPRRRCRSRRATTRTSGRDEQHRARVAQRQRWAPSRLRARGPRRPLLLLLPTRGSLAVRGTGGSE